MVPIFKKGTKQDPSKYRQVSLTVALCKVMEHFIYRSIMQQLEYNNILYAKLSARISKEQFVWNSTPVQYRRPCKESG